MLRWKALPLVWKAMRIWRASGRLSTREFSAATAAATGREVVCSQGRLEAHRWVALASPLLIDAGRGGAGMQWDEVGVGSELVSRFANTRHRSSLGM